MAILGFNKNLKKDFSAIIFAIIRKFNLFWLKVFSTQHAYLLLKLKKISIGKSCEFYGRPTINRYFLSNISIGNNCAFRSDTTSNLVGINHKCIIATFDENAIIQIGDNSRFSGTVIGAKKRIIIGNKVLSGANVLITDFDWHAVDPKLRHTSEGIKSAPVIIGNNVWLGINTVILKGVSIGDNTVIGANSLVVSDIPANVIAAGNPCKVLKKI